MEIKERLKELFDNAHVTPYQVSKETGISQATLSRILNGFTLKMGARNFEILANYFNANPEWILTGVGEMLKSNPAPAIKSSEKSRSGIPLIPIEAMAGYGTGDAQALEYECERYVVPMFRDAEFLIQVKGSSMQPKYNSGDVVACKKLPLKDLFFQWHKVYVLDTIQGALIKRIERGSDTEHIQLVSDNTNYDPFELHLSQIYSIALVIGVIRLE
jgi:phage repressor protein C with HTH and peptisase S24 domain